MAIRLAGKVITRTVTAARALVQTPRAQQAKGPFRTLYLSSQPVVGARCGPEVLGNAERGSMHVWQLLSLIGTGPSIGCLDERQYRLPDILG